MEAEYYEIGTLDRLCLFPLRIRVQCSLETSEFEGT